MMQHVTKSPKVSLCRKCHGTGTVRAGALDEKIVTCPQCEGSGRVEVSCDMTLYIKPYKEKDRPDKNHC